MGIAKGELLIKCTKCGKQFGYDENDADFECISSDDEGCEYLWEEDYSCDCGEDIQIEYQVSEYQGHFNGDEIQIPNFKVLQKFDFEFIVDDNYSDLKVNFCHS